MQAVVAPFRNTCERITTARLPVNDGYLQLNFAFHPMPRGQFVRDYCEIDQGTTRTSNRRWANQVDLVGPTDVSLTGNSPLERSLANNLLGGCIVHEWRIRGICPFQGRSEKLRRRQPRRKRLQLAHCARRVLDHVGAVGLGQDDLSDDAGWFRDRHPR